MTAKKISFYLLTILLAGCIPVMSLHPLYTDHDLVFTGDLLGTWVNDPNKPDNTWQFSTAEPNNQMAYELIFSDDKNKKGLFIARMVNLENKLFLDVYPKQLPCEQPEIEQMHWCYNAFFFVPVHTFVKIESVEPTLIMRLTNDDDLEKLLEDDPNAVKYETAADRIVLTAPTTDLQKFVLKYADDDRLFSNQIALIRKIPNDPNIPALTDPNQKTREKQERQKSLWLLTSKLEDIL